MSYLVWERDLDTGINVIDAQHHRIVEMINRLHAAQGTRRHDIVSEVVEELVDYTLFHFAFEETMIEEAGYPLTEGWILLSGALFVLIGERLSSGWNVTPGRRRRRMLLTTVAFAAACYVLCWWAWLFFTGRWAS